MYLYAYTLPAAGMNFSFTLIAPNIPLVSIGHQVMAVTMWFSIVLYGMLFLFLTTALFPTLKANPQRVEGIIL